MSLDLAHPALAANLPRLSPYLQRALDRAAEHALALHADALSREHVVTALLSDEESAVHRLVVHAFADPETIAFDVLALSPGILVVASDATLPFSPRSVDALHAARDRGVRSGAGEVGPAEVLLESVRVLPESSSAALREAGYDELRLGAEMRDTGSAPLPRPEENLFHRYSHLARQILSKAGRSAFRAREGSIGPARLVLAALELDRSLEERSGLARRRAQLALEGRTADPTPPAEHPLAPDAALSDLLGALPAGAASLDVLAALHREPASELTQAFTRQKVSPALLERARGAFLDPE